MNILIVAMNDLRILLKNKLQFALLLVMPIIMISTMGYALKRVFNTDGGIQRFKVLYVNQDNGIIGKSFDSFIKNDAAKFIEVIDGNIDTAEHDIISGKYPAVIILRQGLSEGYEKGRGADIEVISSGSDQVKDSVVKSILDSYAEFSGVSFGINKSYSDIKGNAYSLKAVNIEELGKKYQMNYVVLKDAVLPGKDKISSFQYFSLTMLLFFMLMSGVGVGVGIAAERSDGIYNRIVSYPIKDHEYLLGKILGNLFLTSLQAMSVIIFTSIVLKVDWGNSFWGIFLTIILIMLISSSMGLIFSAVMNSKKAISPVMTIIIWIISFFGGAFTPVPALEPIAKYTFYKWGIDSLVNFMTGGSFKDASVSLLFLTVTVIILWASGLMLYKRRLCHE